MTLVSIARGFCFVLEDVGRSILCGGAAEVPHRPNVLGVGAFGENTETPHIPKPEHCLGGAFFCSLFKISFWRREMQERLG